MLLLTVILAINKDYPLEKQAAPLYISSELYRQTIRLDSILAADGIKIDYSGVERVIMAPLYPGLQGLYLPENKVIIINSHLKLPPFAPIGCREDYLLVVIAHEMLHAQNVGHVDDTGSLMYDNDAYILSYITTIGPEEFILRTYRKLSELRRDQPLILQSDESTHPYLSE